MCHGLTSDHHARDVGIVARVALCLLALVALMAEPLDAVEEVHLPLAPPIQGALTAGPFNFQFTGEDHLRLSVANSLTGVRVAVHYRTAPTPTTTQTNQQTLAPTADRSINTLEFDVVGGYLLNVVCFASSGTPSRGQTYAKLEVIRGFGASAIVLGCVFAGHVTANQPIAWPGSPIESSTDGDGYIRAIAGTAVFGELSEVVPPGARWELLEFYLRLITDAVAGVRRSGLFFDDGTNPYFRSPQPGTIGPSATIDCYWSQGSPYVTALLTDVTVANLPIGNRLLAGHRIRTATNNLDASDDNANPRYMVREWLDV